MNRVGFPKTTMREESRIALVPNHISKIEHPEMIYIQKGYGSELGMEDSCYLDKGCNVVSREGLSGLEVLCIPKRSHRDLDIITEGQTLVGWLYVYDTPWLQKVISEKHITAIAFEKMYHKNNGVFYWNNIIAGELGMLQAISYAGAPPNKLKNVAVLGNGNTALGAFKILDKFNIKYQVYSSININNFYGKLSNWDMVVSCIKWNPSKGYLLKKDQVKSMKQGCYIVDIAADGVEFSIPQRIWSPVHQYKHVLVYNNEHIPTLWPAHSSKKVSKALVPYVNKLISGEYGHVLEHAKVSDKGILL